jgi:hypothetical protein
MCWSVTKAVLGADLLHVDMYDNDILKKLLLFKCRKQIQ